MKIEKKLWGTFEGKNIWLYTLKNSQIELSISNLGCTVTSIILNGTRVTNRNIILGYDNLADLVKDKYYMGCMVGRFAGRISNASFEINGTRYNLPANDGTTGNHLHGGQKGFNRLVFREINQQCGSNTAVLSFGGTSRHLDQGYPGNLNITFTIGINNSNEITFSYFAEADAATHINLTHHLYYNLCKKPPATNQHLQINASSVLESGENYIPTGRFTAVSGNLDFLSSKKIPETTNYNECYVLQRSNKSEVAAILSDADSGLAIKLSTTCPAIIFYSGHFLDRPFTAKQGICLEAQSFPDSPNQDDFPSTLYFPGQKFKEYTKLTFEHLF